MAFGETPREEWSAILGARKDLGDDYDDAFVEGVMDRVSAEVDARVDSRIAAWRATGAFSRRPGGTFLALASITLGLPASAIAGYFGHLPGLAVAWGGIVLVNFANALRSGGRAGRRPPRRA
jgi:hypothetical protein